MISGGPSAPSRQITLRRCSRTESRDGNHNMRWLNNGTGQALFRGSHTLLLLRQNAGEPALCRKYAARTKVVLQAGTRQRSTRELLQPLGHAASQEGVVKTRCDFCSGSFGLTRRRYRMCQFCCELCENAYKDQRTKLIADFKARLYGSLAATREKASA
jgi:hypothetical protein